MKRNNKITAKILSMFLAILFVFYALPLSAIAEGISNLSSDNGTDIASSDSAANQSTKATTYLNDVYEDISLREESVKHFRLEDGSYIATQYSSPVHYRDESGAWQNIDNTLTESGSELVTSDARVKFIKKTTGNGSIFTLHDGDTKITLSLAGANKKVSGIVTNTEETETTEIGKLMSLEGLTSRIRYNEILDGVDIEYVLDSLSIKENIIIKEKSDEYSYTFTLALNGLEAELLANGDISITKSGEQKYKIPAPVVFDSADSTAPATAAGYSLTDNGNGKYTLTVSVSSEWMNSDERVYPVTLDPAVIKGSSSILDTYGTHGVTSGLASSTTLRVSDYITLIKLNALPALPTGAKVSNATLTMFRTSGTGGYVGASPINSSWSQTAVNVSDLTYGSVLDYAYTKANDDGSYGIDGNGAFVWDITEAAESWYDGTANYGIALQRLSTSGDTFFASVEYSNSAKRPSFTISYVNTLGLEDYYSYSTQSGGAAGTGYVNYATGDLTFAISTLTSTDYLMPVTPTLVYNSALANKSYTSANVTTPYTSPMTSYGFKLNLTESLVRRSYSSEGSTVYYYVWSDADGTEHYFYPTDVPTVFRDDSGLLLTLNVPTSGNPTITDIDKNVREFISYGSNSGSYVLRDIKDKVGNKVNFIYNTSNQISEVELYPGGSNEFVTLELYYTNGVLYQILNRKSNESVFLKYSATYNGEISSSMNYLRQVIYAHGTDSSPSWAIFYNSGSATDVVADATMYYEYDANGYLTSAKNGLANYTVNYEWANGKVSSVYEKGGTTTGTRISLAYGSSYTEITMPSGNAVSSNYSSGIINRYEYDHYFRVTSSYSTDTNRSIIYGATNGTYETQENIKNNIKETVTIGGNPTNYLLNGNFSLTSSSDGILYWNKSHSTIVRIVNGNSAKVKIPYTSGTYYISQKVYLPVGQYTFSFDIETENTQNLKVESVTQRNSLTSETAQSVNINEVKESRYPYTHKMSLDVSAADVYELKIRVTSNGTVSSGATVYISNVKLERSIGVGDYNFVNAGSFDDSYRDATGANLSSVSQSTFWTAIAGTSFVTDNASAFGTVAKVVGKIDESRYLRQTVYEFPIPETPYSPNNDAVFIVSGFAKAPQGAFSNDIAKFALRVDIYYYNGDGTESLRTEYIDFDKDCTDWQFVSAIINTKYENPPQNIGYSYDYFTRIEVSCDFSYQNGGEAYFDNISLIDAGQKRVEYIYNENGLVTAIKGTFDSEYREYDGTNLVRVANDNGELWDYKYENDQIVEEVYYTFRYNGTSKSYPYGYDDPDSVIVKTPVTKTVYEYNGYGQMERAETYPAVASGSNVVKKSGSASLLTVNTYEVTAGSAIFGALLTTSNGAGKTIRYFYDTSRGYLLAEVNVGDRVGTAYTYDAIGNLINAKPATCNSAGTSYSTVNNAESVTYDYNAKNELESITTGSTTYNFTYDNFGRMSSYMGDDVEYGYTLDGKVRYIRYNSTDGNGIISHSYEYDVLGRVVSERYNESFYDESSGDVYYDEVPLYEYEYTSDGKLHRVYDIWNGEYILYDYDALGRLKQIIKSNDENADYYTTPTDVYNDFSVYYTYDDNSDPSRLWYVNYYFSYLTGTSPTSGNIMNRYSYNDNGTLNGEQITAGSQTIGVSYSYDEFFRPIGKTVSNDNNPNDSDPRYTNNVTYEYNVENAADGSLVETGEVKSYTTKVGDTTSIYNYTYDSRGNITSIKLGNTTLSSYSYDDLGQLYYVEDYVNGLNICYYYDNAGNLYERYVEGINDDTLYYDEFTYASSPYGDRLVDYNGESITYDEYGRTSRYRGKNIFYGGYDAHNISYFGNASFTYYEDGMRRTKAVGNVTHYYTYDGINLIREEWGNNTIVFLYDASGSPIGMQYRNSTYASGVWDTYYYEKNLQGDIIAVYSAAGTKLVSYTYDAWGALLSTTYSNGGASTSVVNNPLRYRGYYYDDDLDLYYLATRYYDPEVCRFVTADDPAYLGANGDIISYNLYAYCNNNPVMYADPAGNMPMWAERTIICAAAMGLVAATVLTFVATGIGATVGVAVLSGGIVYGGVNAIEQLHDTGEIDLTEVAIATLSGEAYGLVNGLTGGDGGWAALGKFAVAGGTSLLDSWNENASFDETMKSLGDSLLISGAAQVIGKVASKIFPNNSNDSGSAIWSIPAVKTAVSGLMRGLFNWFFND